jgi:hypothetical protein
VDGSHDGRYGGSDEAQTEWKSGWHVNLFKVEMDRHCPTDRMPSVADA